jgi:hypothetical protein
MSDNLCVFVSSPLASAVNRGKIVVALKSMIATNERESRNPGRLSRTEDSSVNLQTRESEPKHVLESVLLDEAHEQISSQRLCLNIPRQSSYHLCEGDHLF